MAYSRTDLMTALATLRIHHEPIPRIFRDADLEAAWPTLPLEDKISAVAVRFGGPRVAPAEANLITRAYNDLCTKGALALAPPA